MRWMIASVTQAAAGRNVICLGIHLYKLIRARRTDPNISLGIFAILGNCGGMFCYFYALVREKGRRVLKSEVTDLS